MCVCACVCACACVQRDLWSVSALPRRPGSDIRRGVMDEITRGLSVLRDTCYGRVGYVSGLDDAGGIEGQLLLLWTDIGRES